MPRPLSSDNNDSSLYCRSGCAGHVRRPHILPSRPPQPDLQCPDMAELKYKRVLLKISGEGFCSEGGFGLEATELENIASQCVEVAKLGVELAIVVGGGNFVRGADFAEDSRIEQATAHYMGMLATVIN